MIDRKTVMRGAQLLDILDKARELRKGLERNPSNSLLLCSLADDDDTTDGTIIKNVEPDLRLAVIDFLLEQVKARLGDMGIEFSAPS